MVWLRVDDSELDHRRWERIELEHGPRVWADCVAVWLVLGCGAARRLGEPDGIIPDGHIAPRDLRRLPAIETGVDRCLEVLLEVGLLERTDCKPAPLTFIEWEERQRTSEQVAHDREKARERKARERARKRARQEARERQREEEERAAQGSNPPDDESHGVTPPVTDGVSHALPDPDPDPDPIVLPSEEPSATPTARADEPRAEPRSGGELVHLPLTPRKAGPSNADIDRVFARWCTLFGKSKTKLDKKRSDCIRRAIATYGVDDVLLCIEGYATSKWHRGENDRRKPYTSITLFLRDADHVDDGIDLARARQGRTPRSPLEAEYKRVSALLEDAVTRGDHDAVEAHRKRQREIAEEMRRDRRTA